VNGGWVPKRPEPEPRIGDARNLWPNGGNPLFDKLNKRLRFDKKNEAMRVHVMRLNEQNQLNRLGWRDMVRTHLVIPRMAPDERPTADSMVVVNA